MAPIPARSSAGNSTAGSGLGSRTSSTGSFGGSRSPNPYAGASGFGGIGGRLGAASGAGGGGGNNNLSIGYLSNPLFTNLTDPLTPRPDGNGRLTPIPSASAHGPASDGGYSIPDLSTTSSKRKSQADQPTITAGLGWGIGLTNSGTYTASKCPKHLVLPMPPQDPEVFGMVKEVIVRRKRQRAAKRAAELVQGDLIDKAVNEAKEAAVQAAKEAREAVAKLDAVRSELIKKRKEKEEQMAKIDAEFDGQLRERIRAVEREYEKMIQEVMAEEVVAEEVRPEDLEEYRDLFVEKTEKEEGDKDEETEKEKEEGEAMEVDEQPIKPEAVEEEPKVIDDTAAEAAAAAAEEEDGVEIPKKKKRRLMSEIKTEDLDKAKTDLDGLNETKAQMVWLLKQVIVAENKRNILIKKREKAKKDEVAAAAAGSDDK